MQDEKPDPVLHYYLYIYVCLKKESEMKVTTCVSLAGYRAPSLRVGGQHLCIRASLLWVIFWSGGPSSWGWQMKPSTGSHWHQLAPQMQLLFNNVGV